MTWGPRAQRRADEFDALVEQLTTGHGHDARSTHDAELLELVGALRAVPVPEPRPEFVADLRGRLMTEAETALVPTDVTRLQLPARRTKRERRIAAVVGGLALVGATTSVAMASQSALPGESLYPIKRVLESAHTGLSVGEASKGGTELDSAASRLDEAAALVPGGSPAEDDRIAQTLGTFTEQATSGADLLLADYAHTGHEASIVRLHDFASSSMEQLEALEPQVPYVARDELIAAASTVAQIDARATLQCPTCGGATIGSIPPTLAAGEQVTLPPTPAARPTQEQPGQSGGDGRGKRGDTKSSGSSGGQDDPVLPDVDGAIGPGSVLDPDAADPSTSSHPLKDLTDGLTGVLTGKGSTGTSGGSGPRSTESPSPLAEVVGGVDEILQGVLDPVTGLLAPTSKP